MKNNRFWVKSGLFLIISYLLIPLVFDYLTKDKELLVRYNFFSFPAYTLIMVILFTLFNRKTIQKSNYKNTLFSSLSYSILALLFLILYYYFRYLLIYNLSNFPIWILISGFFYFAAIFCIALAIFGFELFKRTYISLLLFAIITYLFYALTQLLWKFWGYFAYGVAFLSNLVISIFLESNYVIYGNTPTLGIRDFSVVVGAPCSGIESISMFIGLFLLLIIYEQEKLNFSRTSILFIIGLIGTYLLNVLRILLILLIGVKYPSFALGLFHSQAGWIIFSLFMLILMYLGYNWIVKKD